MLLLSGGVRGTRARGRQDPLAGAGGLAFGFGFLTKMLQAFLVLPAFGVAYLIAGPPRLRTRVWQLVLGGLADACGGRVVGRDRCN